MPRNRCYDCGLEFTGTHCPQCRKEAGLGDMAPAGVGLQNVKDLSAGVTIRSPKDYTVPLGDEGFEMVIEKGLELSLYARTAGSATKPKLESLTLRATIGLQRESVGRVKLPIGEGLVGLAAERRAPVVIECAEAHPRYKYFPETGEKDFTSLMAVPLTVRGSTVGVLVSLSIVSWLR